MIFLGKAIGGVDFAKLKYVIQTSQEAVLDATGAEVSAAVPEVAIQYGMFINAIITFVIVAFTIFMVVKAYNKMKKKEEAAPATPPAPSKEEVLLSEIRDLLKSKA